MLHVFDENMSEYVKNLMTVTYNGDPKEIKEYLQMVFDFLEESNIEVPDDILDEQNLDEQTYSLFSFLIVGNYIEDQTIKAQVLELTLSYYNAHNPKHEQELLEFSFTQDR